MSALCFFSASSLKLETVVPFFYFTLFSNLNLVRSFSLLPYVGKNSLILNTRTHSPIFSNIPILLRPTFFLIFFPNLFRVSTIMHLVEGPLSYILVYFDHIVFFPCTKEGGERCTQYIHIRVFWILFFF